MRLLVRPTWLTPRTPLSRLLRLAPPSAVHHTSTTNVARTEIPRLLVKPGSSYHNSLASFLEHAARSNLLPNRTIYIGTHYEYTVAEALLRLGFSLIRTGQKNDAGIDLVGHWMLSVFREPMPVIIQCKARENKCSPVEIRELEGAFHSVPQDWRNKDVLGVLVSPARASEGLRKQMYLSRRPVAFLQISRSGLITQFLWNRAAAERGMEGVGVTPRYTVLPLAAVNIPVRCRDANGRWVKGSNPPVRIQKPQVRTVVTDIQLTWMGTPIFPDKEGLALETARRISQVTDPVNPVKRKRGRPKGSKNRPKLPKKEDTLATMEMLAVSPAVTRGRGRPRGSSEVNPFDGNCLGEIVAKAGVKRRKPRKRTGELATSND